MDVDLGSASDDDLEPGSLGGRVGENPQDGWASPCIATLVQCVDDKDESMGWVMRKGADEIKEESIFHRLCGQVWIAVQVFRDNPSKRRVDFCKLVDESREDIFRVVRIGVISLAKEPSDELLSLLKFFTDGMSQRCFADSG